MNRRDFLKVGVAGTAVAATGCEKIRAKFGDWIGGGGVPDAFSVASGTTIDERVHLLNRAAFGAWPGDLDRVTQLGREGWIEEQLNPGAINDLPCTMRTRGFESVTTDPGDMYDYKKPFIESELTRFTILQAVYSKRQLFEVMVEFWSDHFNIHIGKADCAYLKAPDDRLTIRAHALGRFRDMVKASALSPAMLVYLDGRENRKAGPNERPNENYARELLELHTLGVHGGYSQNDVMEVARCLTGWSCRRDGEFFKARVEFHVGDHDDGEKKVLGHKIPAGLKEQDLERVLDILCYHESTAKYIAEKLCRRFIADDPPMSAVAKVANAFQTSWGDIKHTLRTLLACDEFRNTRGNKFKRPFRFIVSALRSVGAMTNASPALLKYFGAMGQAPFQHATPDGYADEQAPWLGTLMWRWNFCLALTTNSINGTTIDASELAKAMNAPGNGEIQTFLRHAMGRDGLAIERDVVEEYTRLTTNEDQRRRQALGLILASPGFQRC